MRWIVDGMNVIGSRPDGWWRDRTAAMRRLVQALRGSGAHVVLDGHPRELAAPPDVTVEWADGPGPDAADHVIAARVAAEPDRWHVVTSDGSLAARARADGAPVTGAGAFRRHLEDGRPPAA